MINTLRYLFPDIDFLRDCRLQDDGDGVYIREWRREEPQPTAQELLSAEVPAAKASRKKAFNVSATFRILAKYPIEKQSSATLGIYPQAYRETMALEIASIISASNTACDTVDAATTVAEVDAITVNWPVI